MPRDPSPNLNEPASKRRKVRKGTQSCWECKRRKVRCLFAVSTNSVCDNCIRRKTTCISQEYVDELETASHKPANGFDARLNRVENMLDQLASREPHPARSESTDSDFSHHSKHPENTLSIENVDASGTSSEALLTPLSTSSSSKTSLVDRYSGLARDLIAAWPNPLDLETIYDLPAGVATHLHMSGQKSASSRKMLQLPPPGSHPVLIARKLLILASLLQGALSTSNMLKGLKPHFRAVMSRVLETVTRLVTSNDDLIASIEGVECIMLEVMIQNYSGNLHRAWLTLRRALAVAQLMGLHRGSKSTLPKFVDPATKAQFDPEEFCFAITNLDCYLSVTLGLPRSSFKTRALTQEALARCQPLHRLARSQCIIADRILERRGGESACKSVVEIHEIDQLLQDAAAEMPPQWWLIPDFDSNIDDKADSFPEIGRAVSQFAHYNLVVRLHLPFLLRASPDARYDHSKFTVLNTSRDILTLYIAFRKWNSGHFYCRGIDYLVFEAVATLCVAHVNTRRPTAMSQSNTSVEKSLILGRLRDRGMMERTLYILNQMEDDAIAANLSRIIQHLLDVEDDAFKGAAYSTSTKESDIAADACDGDYVDGAKVYQLRMPFFGTISLQRETGANPHVAQSGPTMAMHTNLFPDQEAGSDQTPIPLCGTQWSEQVQAPYDNFETYSHGSQAPPMLDMPNNWTLQSINDSLFDSIFGGMDDQEALWNMADQ